MSFSWGIATPLSDSTVPGWSRIASVQPALPAVRGIATPEARAAGSFEAHTAGSVRTAAMRDAWGDAPPGSGSTVPGGSHIASVKPWCVEGPAPPCK